MILKGGRGCHNDDNLTMQSKNRLPLQGVSPSLACHVTPGNRKRDCSKIAPTHISTCTRAIIWKGGGGLPSLGSTDKRDMFLSHQTAVLGTLSALNIPLGPPSKIKRALFGISSHLDLSQLANIPLRCRLSLVCSRHHRGSFLPPDN